MLLTVTFVLIATAFVTTIMSMMSPPKCPLYIPVLLLCIIALLSVLPRG